MPIKTFKCMYCGNTHEYLVSIDASRVTCDTCGKDATERVWANDLPVIRGETCPDKFYNVRNQKITNPNDRN